MIDVYGIILLGFIAVLFIALVVIGGVGLWIFVSFKHRIRLRCMTAQGSFIINDWAKEVTDDGVKKWKLLFTRKKINIPPRDAIFLGKKGRLFADAYYDKEDETTAYITVKYIKESGQEIKYDALSSDERMSALNQITKAVRNRGTSVGDIILKYGPLALILLFIIVMAVLSGDIFSNYSQLIDKHGYITEQQARLMQHIEAVEFKIQSIEANPSIKVEKPPD